MTADAPRWLTLGVLVAVIILVFRGAQIITRRVLPLGTRKPLAYLLLFGGPFLVQAAGQMSTSVGVPLIAALIASSLGIITAH